jgi:hypothetical protein
VADGPCSRLGLGRYDAARVGLYAVPGRFVSNTPRLLISPGSTKVFIGGLVARTCKESIYDTRPGYPGYTRRIQASNHSILGRMCPGQVR